jgi:hypothetical protein
MGQEGGRAGRGTLVLAALVVWAAAAGAQETGTSRSRDVLYLLAGGAPEGSLQGCSAQACTLDDTPYPRSAIVMIGLGVRPQDAPPPIADAFVDAVNPRDMPTWEPGRLTTVDAGSVTTEARAYARRDIAWIYLAPTAAGAGSAPEDDEAPGGEPGALWTGRIVARWTTEESGAVTTVTAVADPARLREVRFPLMLAGADGALEIGTFTRLDTEGTVLTQTVETTGACSGGGQGTATLTRPEESSASAIWTKTEAVDATPLLGADLPEGESVYAVGLVALLDDNAGATHRSGMDCGTGYSEYDVGFTPIGFGRHPGPGGAGPGFDPQTRVLDGDRMSGSYDATVEGADWSVSWSLCRDGAPCPPPP